MYDDDISNLLRGIEKRNRIGNRIKVGAGITVEDVVLSDESLTLSEKEKLLTQIRMYKGADIYGKGST